MTEDSRIERDSFGDIAVPSWAYWGAQTQRSKENFPIGGQQMPIDVVHALARVKLAAAQANAEKGLIKPDVALETDEKGRVKLSMKALLDRPAQSDDQQQQQQQ